MRSQDSSITLYVREILETELLTAEQEIELASKISQGDENAREHLIKANLRLVVNVANDYTGYGVSLSDLISEGNIGLMKAADKYDPSKGGKFSTYAVWWIKQYLKRALSKQSKTIRLPIHIIDKVASIRRIILLLTDQLGREPSNQELSDELGIPASKFAILKQYAQTSLSLDGPAFEGEETRLSETICDTKAADPSLLLEDKNIYSELHEVLSNLDKRQATIIDSRFGLNGKKPMTLEEISHDFGLSRERIRQLQNMALEKMRRILQHKEKIESADFNNDHLSSC